jgi:hypothetical protein
MKNWKAETICIILASMIDYVISHFGTTKIKAISSIIAQIQDKYVVEEMRKVRDNAVMWRRLNFEKIVFNSHQVCSFKILMYV